MRADPHELSDRADDPTCRAVLEALTGEVLDGWDVERIARAMAAKRADLPILKGWAKQVDPPDQHRWRLVPRMNFLEDP